MISLRRRHPSYEVLSRHADRELPAVQAMELNAHLAECRDCRAEVDFMGDLRNRLGELSGPAVPRTLLPEILSLRQMGERVILEPGPESESRADARRSNLVRAAMPAAAALVLVTGGLAFLGVNRVDAGFSSLDVELDRASQPAGFRFATAGALAKEDVVRARGVYYARAGGSWNAPLAVRFESDLPRTGAGQYAADLHLPVDVVYARFSVEDISGEVVAGGVVPWDFLATRPDGIPTFAALSAKSRGLVDEQRYIQGAQAAHKLTQLYPERPGGWLQRWIAEQLAPRSVVDYDEALHRARLKQFVSRIDDGVNSDNPDYVASVASYASSLRDPSFPRLLEQLNRIGPAHPWAVATRVAFMTESGPDLFRAFEEEWDTYRTFTPGTFASITRTAADADDALLTMRWVARWTSAFPNDRVRAARRLADLTAPTPEVVVALEEAVAWAESGGLVRPIGLSAQAHAVETAGIVRNLLIALGRHQLRIGLVDRGQANLLRAADRGWDSGLFEELRNLAIQRGDREEAMEFMVLLVSDPLATPAEVARWTAALGEMGVGYEELIALQEDLASEISRRVFYGHEPVRFAGPFPVEGPNGLTRDLEAELGAVTIVQFWSPESPTTKRRVESLEQHCTTLDAMGIRLLRLTTELPSVGLDRSSADAAACKGGFYYDRDRTAHHAFRRTLLGEIVVLDDRGQLRFRGTDVEDARRAAHLLAGSLLD